MSKRKIILILDEDDFTRSCDQAQKGEKFDLIRRSELILSLSPRRAHMICLHDSFGEYNKNYKYELKYFADDIWNRITK